MRDCGIVMEEHLKFKRARGARYLVDIPKSMLQKFEREFVFENWQAVRPDVESIHYHSPDSGEETILLCRSTGRKKKLSN